MVEVFWSLFGQTADGQDVHQWELKLETGLSITIMSYGATLRSVKIPDAKGVAEECTLGYNTVADYETKNHFFGSIAGRFANRIADGKFTLNDQSYTLAVNNGPNSLHGGLKGFDQQLWHGEARNSPDEGAVRLTYTSKDGEEGYPGAVTVVVIYTLKSDATLHIDYEARADKDTPFNITNHTYFNLGGVNTAPNVLGHKVKMNCSHYLPVNDVQIPTGELKNVKDTPFDFLEENTIGSRVDAAGGYDHCFVIDRSKPSEFVDVATVEEPNSTRKLVVKSDQPGVQFYTGNFLPGKSPFGKHAGFCLETQAFPDGVNQPELCSKAGVELPILKAGKVFKSKTTFEFRLEKSY